VEQADALAVVGKLAHENDLNSGVDEIIVSNGTKQVLFDAMVATLEASDAVLMRVSVFRAV
jgi:aspartate aminotransferase